MIMMKQTSFNDPFLSTECALNIHSATLNRIQRHYHFTSLMPHRQRRGCILEVDVYNSKTILLYIYISGETILRTNRYN